MTHDPFAKYREVTVDHNTKRIVLKKSELLMNPKIKDVSLKYSLLFVGSIFLSLIVCPQRGVGLFRESYPFFHHLLHQSEVLCGLYCGLVFYTTTHVLSFFLLTHFERLVLVKKITYLPLLFISLFFGLTMTSLFSNLELSPYYFVSWISIAFTGYLTLSLWYKNSYKGKTLS